MKMTSVQLKRSQKLSYPMLGKVGKVISYTSIAVGPQGLEKHVPYIVALVSFGKLHVTLPLVEVSPAEVKVGMKVRGVLRRMQEPEASEVIVYGVKGEPVDRRIRRIGKSENQKVG